jgi:hypothetical protein
MGKCNIKSREAQEKRSEIKTLNQQMKKTAIEGTGISPWEAEVLVDYIDELYFTDNSIDHLKTG